ncbi:MAG: hypothetical protein ACFFCQ_05975, partial [Promethearchaeota archaeon]
MEQETQETKKSIVLDCNLWIKIVSEKDSDFTKHVLTGNYLVILTSYMVVEILRVLKRLSHRLPVPSA